MSKIDDEDDLNDGLDDDEWLCGGETDPRTGRAAPRYSPYSSPYSSPYHGPWDYSQNTTVDYLVQAHKREITSLKSHYEEKLILLNDKAQIQSGLLMSKIQFQVIGWQREKDELKKENEVLKEKLKRS